MLTEDQVVAYNEVPKFSKNRCKRCACQRTTQEANCYGDLCENCWVGGPPPTRLSSKRPGPVQGSKRSVQKLVGTRN